MQCLVMSIERIPHHTKAICLVMSKHVCILVGGKFNDGTLARQPLYLNLETIQPPRCREVPAKICAFDAHNAISLAREMLRNQSNRCALYFRFLLDVNGLWRPPRESTPTELADELVHFHDRVSANL